MRVGRENPPNLAPDSESSQQDCPCFLLPEARPGPRNLGNRYKPSSLYPRQGLFYLNQAAVRMARVQSSCLGQLLKVKRARASHSLGNGWHRVLLACYTPPHPELGWANSARHEILLREEARRSGTPSSVSPCCSPLPLKDRRGLAQRLTLCCIQDRANNHSGAKCLNGSVPLYVRNRAGCWG